MSIDTYADLKTEVQADLARTDLAARIQRWVSQAEKLIFRGGVFEGRRVSGLRTREMEKINATLTATGGKFAVPSDYISPLELRLASDLSITQKYLPSEQLFKQENETYTDGTGYYSEIASEIYVRPSPADATAFWLRYVHSPAALTETTQETNAIFPLYSDLYFEATLWKAFEYVRNYEAASRKLQTVVAMIDGYNRERISERQGEAALVIAPYMAA